MQNRKTNQPSEQTVSRITLLRAARIIRAGGVVAYPTEGVFGLGCDPNDLEAVLRILEIKRRQASAGLILIAASAAQLDAWIEPTSAERKSLAAAADHPITWVVTAKPGTPVWITGDRPTVAVRITDHPVAAALCRFAQTPLISTSANVAGRSPATSALQVRCRLGSAVDWVVPGAVGANPGPTEIRLARSGAILRQG